MLDRVVLHRCCETGSVREVIGFFEKGKTVLKRLLILIGVSIIHALLPEPLNVACNNIGDLIASRHALRRQLNTDFKRAVIAVERLVARRHQLTD